MAIYVNTSSAKRSRANEIGIDMRAVQGPPLPAGALWGDALLYYWAQQISFYNNAGAHLGAGHIGIQAYDITELPTRTVVNWGCYDDSVAGQFRSSTVHGPQFTNFGNDVSLGYPWDYGEWIRFRVFRSPKQNWLAADLAPGDNQVAPYVGTNQQASEVAFRCTIQNLTRGTPPVVFHDVLVKNAATNRPMSDDGFWTEPIPQASWPGTIEVDWPHDPICDFRNVDFDGPGHVTLCQRTYGATTANCDTLAVNAAGGQPGYIRMSGGVTRTQADDTTFAPPTGYWATPQANVAATPDPAAPGTTPRPWF